MLLVAPFGSAVRRAAPQSLGLLSLGAVLCCACAAPPDEEPPPERTGEARAPITVAEAADAGCSTIAVKGLSLQIIAQSNCLSPGAFVAIPEQPNVAVQDTVFAFLEAPAQEAFVAAVSSRPDLTLTLNSALRTVAQQYLLYRWYQEGACGIGLAATPGNSNHETGLALDVSEYQTWRPILEDHGFTWLGSSDPVHFDYAGPGAVDYRGTDVLAFQILWNLNNPDDPIDEDGEWGPQTQARMEQSPAEGFPVGASCGDAPDVWLASSLPGVGDRFADGASAGVFDVFEGDTVDWTVELENRGQAAAAGVTVVLEHDDFVALSSASIERAPARGEPAVPAGTTPLTGPSAPVTIGAMAPGEVVTLRVSTTAAEYSVESEPPAVVRAFVSNIDEHYGAASFGGDVTGDGSQTFGGGRLEVTTSLDVYSRLRWEFESDRREGFTGAGSVAVAAGSLEITPQSGAFAVTPVLTLTGGPETKISIRARRGMGQGAASLLLFDADSVDLANAVHVPLDLPADGVFHDIVVTSTEAPSLAGTTRRIGFSPFDAGQGASAIDWLRVEGATSTGLPPAQDDDLSSEEEDEDGCSCRLAASGERSGSPAVWVGLWAAAALAQRVARRRPPKRRAA